MQEGLSNCGSGLGEGGVNGWGDGGNGRRTLVERIQDWCKGSPLGKANKEK